jgi:nucleotide-binding universal stress UspA family protein
VFHVLLPVDESSDRARLAAETVVGLPGDGADVRVTVLYVEEELSLSEVDEERVGSKEWLEAGDPPESIDVARSVLEDAGVRVDVRRELDDPAAAIVAVAEELGVDHVVMSGRKRSAVGKVLFGSTTQGVLLSSPVPVTVAME